MIYSDLFSIITYGVCLGFGSATVLFVLSLLLGVLLSVLKKY